MPKQQRRSHKSRLQRVFVPLQLQVHPPAGDGYQRFGRGWLTALIKPVLENVSIGMCRTVLMRVGCRADVAYPLLNAGLRTMSSFVRGK